MDRITSRVDISWEQNVPGIVKDDIDRDPQYNEYLYYEADDYDNVEMEMEVDEAMPALLDAPRAQGLPVGGNRR